MKLEEFEIGKTFWCSGRPSRCTDTGTQVVVAIRLEHDDASWFNGPPYAVAEQCSDDSIKTDAKVEPDPYDVEQLQTFVQLRTELPALSYPDDVMRFLDFIAELDISDGHVAAAKRAKLQVLMRFIERDDVTGSLRDGFVVEAAFRRRAVTDEPITDLASA